MNNKKLFVILFISFILIFSTTLIIFSILGNKNRIGYLGEFKFDESHINNTLELNGFDTSEIKKLFTIDNILDSNALTNYIFTNESITNYSYGFRLKYYDKIFRNSDIYDVYLDTQKTINDNSFIKNIKMEKDGSPFGTLTTTKAINTKKIDNIKYTLKIKDIVYLYMIMIYLFSIFLFYGILVVKENKLVLVSTSLLIIIQIFIYFSLYNYFRLI